MNTNAPDNGYLLMKRGLYWRPNAQGYTGIKEYAGRYSHEEVALRVGINGPDGSTDGISAIHESSAPDYSPSCCSDVQIRHMSEKLNNLKQQAIERGYVQHCLYTGKWAWTGECE